MESKCNDACRVILRIFGKDWDNLTARYLKRKNTLINFSQDQPYFERLSLCDFKNVQDILETNKKIYLV